MTKQDESSIQLSPLSALTLSDATFIVRRGIQDLVTITEADEWCRRGLVLWNEEKHAEAAKCFATGLEIDPDHAALQFYLGLVYYLGVGVREPDYEQAAICWRKAGEQGYAQAQNNLAQAYEKGHGVTRNLTQAAYWYRKAADQDHAMAQFNLGVLYEAGEGVPQDFAHAVFWYHKAAEQDLAVAEYNLGGMPRQGRGVAQSDAAAAYWYERSAWHGHAEAQFNLAVIYGLGQGLLLDREKSEFWFRRAADQGDLSARQMLTFSPNRSNDKEGIGEYDHTV